MSTIVHIKDVRLYMFESCSAGDKDVVLERNYLNTYTHVHRYAAEHSQSHHKLPR